MTNRINPMNFVITTISLVRPTKLLCKGAGQRPS